MHFVVFLFLFFFSRHLHHLFLSLSLTLSFDGSSILIFFIHIAFSLRLICACVVCTLCTYIYADTLTLALSLFLLLSHSLTLLKFLFSNVCCSVQHQLECQSKRKRQLQQKWAHHSSKFSPYRKIETKTTVQHQHSMIYWIVFKKIPSPAPAPVQPPHADPNWRHSPMPMILHFWKD